MGGPGSGRIANKTISDALDDDDAMADLERAKNPLPALLDLGDGQIPAKLREIPDRPLAMLILRGCRLSQHRIAAVMGIKQPTVHWALHKYDPKGVFVLSREVIEQIALGQWAQLEQVALCKALDGMDGDLTPVESTRIAAQARDKQIASRQPAPGPAPVLGDIRRRLGA